MSCTETTMCYSLAMRAEVGGAGKGLRAVNTVDLRSKVGGAKTSFFGVAYHTSAQDRGLMLNSCPFCGGSPGVFAQAQHKPVLAPPTEVYLVCASYLNTHQDIVMAFLDQEEAGIYRDACKAYLATKPVCPPTADSEENDRLWDCWADDLAAWRKGHPIGEFYDCDLVEVKAVPVSKPQPEASKDVQ